MSGLTSQNELNLYMTDDFIENDRDHKRHRKADFVPVSNMSGNTGDVLSEETDFVSHNEESLEQIGEIPMHHPIGYSMIATQGAASVFAVFAGDN